MKRTAIKRKTGLKSRSTTKRSMGKPDPRWRSRAYLDWVKAQPCVVCGCPADDPHHAKGIGNLSGSGLTAPDSMAMPVCREHHDEIHQDPTLWPEQWRWVALTLAKAIDEGVLTLGKAP